MKDAYTRLDGLLNTVLKRKLMFWRTATAGLFVANVASGFVMANHYTQSSASYMEVYNISVPDHRVGDDPKIVYSRKVHKPFRGQWLVEARHADTDQRVLTCKTGSGVDSYEAGAKTLRFTLSYYGNWTPDTCTLPPGCYTLYTAWHILSNGDTLAPVVNRSEPFCVKKS